jgi:hypothetical protein
MIYLSYDKLIIQNKHRQVVTLRTLKKLGLAEGVLMVPDNWHISNH